MKNKIKELLLQMKLDENYEMRILAEEEILNAYTDLLEQAMKLRDVLERFKKEPVGIINPDRPFSDIMTFPAKEAISEFDAFLKGK